MNKLNEQKILLNALKAKRRQEEIEFYGKLVSFRPLVTANRKKYNRKRNKRIEID